MLKRREFVLKVIMHDQYGHALGTRSSTQGVMKFTILVDTYFAILYVFSLMSDQCLQVEKKIFKEIIMHIHFITDTCMTTP